MGYGKLYHAAAPEEKGDHHTHALTVGGMVVATMPEEGSGEDDVKEIKQPVGKGVSFRAKQLSQM